MKKILFYCQYLAGMGHLVRSTELVKRLVQDFQVCFVIGGGPISEFHCPEGIRLVYLPPLREESGQLIAQAQSLESIQAQRCQRLLETFRQFQPDCVITECFPFSKYKMAFELIPLLDTAKAQGTQIICSLRDLIMTQSMSPKGSARKQSRIHQQIRQYYDLILYHSDRNFQPLEDCFPSAAELDCEVFYTGYVARSPQISTTDLIADGVDLTATALPIIIVSAGGGRDGFQLLYTAMEASRKLAQILPHRMYVFTGPFMPAEHVEKLRLARSPTVTLSCFTPHLGSYLAQADLSISLGGYNTTMDILNTGVRALVCPSPSVDQVDEQRIRATKLAKREIVRLIEPKDLTAPQLSQLIMSALAQPKPQHLIDLQGIEKSAWRIKQLLAAEGQVPEPVASAPPSLQG